MTMVDKWVSAICTYAVTWDWPLGSGVELLCQPLGHPRHCVPQTPTPVQLCIQINVLWEQNIVGGTGAGNVMATGLDIGVTERPSSSLKPANAFQAGCRCWYLRVSHCGILATD